MGLQKLTIERMQELAKEKGGKCLSKEYINRVTPLRWRCKKRHEWDTTPGSIIGGNWCLLCSNNKNKNHGNKKTTLEEINRIAKEKGGKCLSKEYQKYQFNGKITKLKWQCKKGHDFEMKLNHIKSGHWCPYCVKRARLTIKEMKQIAKIRGGKCLSNKYINAYTPLRWECHNGHNWIAIPGSIKSLHWCPYCAEKKTEKYCRQIFEEIFKVKFEKKRPKWLKYKRCLELDGFNDSIITPIGRGLAFEYNGKQHYSFNNYFHKECSLFELKKHDIFKIKKCKEQNIILIVIPYSIKYNQIKDYIIKELEKNNMILNIISQRN